MSCNPAVTLAGLTGSAFLDRHGRFAKHPDDVAIVRLYYGASSIDMTADDFVLLTDAERLTIQESGSGAGLIVTAGKSNA